jgi:glycosyltransferase involved in cell wall biosynthesis
MAAEGILTSTSQINIGKRKSLCLVIPTYNERENISKLLPMLNTVGQNVELDLTVIVVDDNSSDGTADVVREAMSRSPNLKLIERKRLMGLGSAYTEGFKYALQICKCDYLGEMDADLQHPPQTLLEMCQAAETGKDVVIASRYVSGGGSSGWTLRRRFVSRSANLLSKILLRAPVRDATSGFRILSARAVLGLFEFELSSKGYAFQVESLYVYKKLGMSFEEVPFIFEERKTGKTKLSLAEMFRFGFVVARLGIFGLKKRVGEGSSQFPT